MKRRIAALLLVAASAPAFAAEPLRLDLGSQTRLVYEPKPWSPTHALPQDAGRAPPQAMLGLEFAGRSATRDVKSLLRVQLSADSMLNFRPRGGGLHVTYRSTF